MRLLRLALLIGSLTAVPGAARAQLGMGEGSWAGAGKPVGTRAIPLPWTDEPAGPEPGLSFRRPGSGFRPGAGAPVFRPGEEVEAVYRADGEDPLAPSLALHFPGLEGAGPLALVPGPEREATVRFRLAEPLAALPATRPHESLVTFATTDAGDADALADELASVVARDPGAAARLPVRRVARYQEVLDLAPRPPNQDPQPLRAPVLPGSLAGRRYRATGEAAAAPEVGGAELFGAGGALLRAAEVRGAGSRRAEGSLAVAARASWIYFSGHYPHDEGGSFDTGAGPAGIEPIGVDATAWKGAVDVVIFAACYAVGAAGRAVGPGEEPWTGPADQGGSAEKDLLLSLTGPLWWEKFQGTLLGYRASAPTRGAPAVSRAFVRLAARPGPDPSDRVATSRFLARAWMAANAQVGARYASALDAEGTYYFFKLRPEPPFAEAPRKDRDWWTVSRAGWEGFVDAGREGFLQVSGLAGALKSALDSEYGGRPPAPEVLLANPAVARILEGAGFDLARPEIRASVLGLLPYQEHLFYDLAESVPSGLRWLVRTAPRETPPGLAACREHFRREGATGSVFDRFGAARAIEVLVQAHFFRLKREGVSNADAKAAGEAYRSRLASEAGST